jgi:membrane protein insertase Oxa1/YidC/SpoIIIJ
LSCYTAISLINEGSNFNKSITAKLRNSKGNSYFLNFTGDYGLAIVLLTVGVRIVLLPMSFKQRKSMQHQQKLAVKMQEIKEKYKENKDKFDEEVN